MKINIKCRECEKEYHWEYDTYVNLAEKPEFKEKLMAGKAFIPTCSCGCQEVVQYSLLYVDPEKKLAIVMVPPENIDISKVEDRPAKEVQKILDSGDYTMRMVENSNDLAEKVITFDNGYDDRLIEMVKVCYYDAIRNQLKKEETELADMLFGCENGQASFWVRLDDGRTMSLDLEPQIYEDLEKDMAGKMDELTPEAFAIINIQWAFKTLYGEQ